VLGRKTREHELPLLRVDLLQRRNIPDPNIVGPGVSSAPRSWTAAPSQQAVPSRMITRPRAGEHCSWLAPS
jgi:hypothetical protein